MMINGTYSVISVIKRFSLHKMRKSFTDVNLVDKRPGRKKSYIELLDNNCYCCKLASSGSYNTIITRHREASITEMPDELDLRNKTHFDMKTLFS